MATNVTFNGVTYSVPAANEEGWQALSNYLIALAGASVSGGSQSLAVRVATTATVTAATSDAVILINRAGAVTVNLPAGVDKQVLWIGDISGAAETNNITINRNGSNTIFGGTSYVLNQNNQVACFIFSSANGNWNRIAESKLPANGAAATLLKSDGTKLIYAKLVDADVDPTAAIARTKLASGSASHVIINDGSGVLTSEAQLAVSRGGTGVTTSTGSGSVVLSNSPTLVTPNLGTPSALVLTNATGTPTSIGLANGTGLPIDGGTTGTLPIARGGTGLTALGTSLQFLRVNVGATALEYATVSGLGDVIGPSGGVVDNEIVLFSSTTGKAIKGAGGALTLSTGLTIGGANGVVLTAADSTGAGSIRLRSNNASASARDWGFLLDANTIGGIDLYVSLTKNGNPNAGINILTITSSLLRVVDIQTQFARNTNQIILGTTNATTINSTAPSASRIYTIPDAGADTNFIMGAGTNTIAGTLTLPATVNYTSNGSIVKSGNHALTLVTSGTSNATFPTGTFTLAILGANTFTAAQTITAASNQIVLSSGVNQLTLNSSTSAAARVYSFPDVGTAGTVAMLEGAQTFSALKTFSSGLNVSGGSAANGSIWFASNALRQRGGTSGWAVDNTSGTAIISATDTGTVTIANSTSSTLVLSKSGNNPFLLFASSAGNAFGIENNVGTFRILDNAATGVLASLTQAGALTVGTSSANVKHILQSASTSPVAQVWGYGTGGAYLQITEDAVKDWLIGMDNGSAVLKIRQDTISGTTTAEFSNTGAVTLNQIHNLTTGNINSGRYTPTLTGVTNIAATGTAQSAHYTRTGNTVTVSCRITSTTTTAAAPTVSRLAISLPIASNFTSVNDASGTGCLLRTSAGLATVPAIVIGDATNDRVDFYFNSNTTSAYDDVLVTFQYEVK